jgi:hypothetical protein
MVIRGAENGSLLKGIEVWLSNELALRWAVA